MTTRPTNTQVFWLFGLSGAGKSTLAQNLAEALRVRGIPVLGVDGDVLRSGVCRGLGYSEGDRTENLRRAAEIARLGHRSGLCVVASFITPLETQRKLIAGIIGRPPLASVYVNAPLEICQRRDAKGLYTRAKAGGVQQMTGMTSPFDPPMNPDFVVDTASEPVERSSARLLAFALAKAGAAE